MEDKKKHQSELANDLASILQQETSAALGFLPPQISQATQSSFVANPDATSGMLKGGNMPSDVQLEEEPLYVNAKQYHRILKRRAARAKWEAQVKASKAKKPYLHESRHRHAMRRPRGPGGRFLTAAEIAELKKSEAGKKEVESK